MHLTASSQAVKLGLALEVKLFTARQFVHPPEADIMPCGFVLASGITQTNN